MTTPNAASEAAPVSSAPQAAPKLTTCPECGEGFVKKSYQQTFCEEKCKKAFHNRAAVDGRAVIAQLKAWRLSRNAAKDSADRALGGNLFSEVCTTLDNMLERDRAEGRSTRMTLDYARGLGADGRDWRDRATTSTWGRRTPRPEREEKPAELDPLQEALQAIAAGHNDPRALAEAVLAASKAR